MTEQSSPLSQALAGADNPHSAAQMQRRLNQTRIAVSHSNRQRQDLELQRDDAMRARAALVERHSRTLDEINDLDRAISALDAGIKVLMEQTQ